MRNLELAALPFAIWYGIVGLQMALRWWRGTPPPEPIDPDLRKRHLGAALIGFVLLALWITWANQPDY